MVLLVSLFVVIPSFVTLVLILPEVWFSTIGFFIVVVGNSCFVTLGFVGVTGIFVVIPSFVTLGFVGVTGIFVVIPSFVTLGFVGVTGIFVVIPSFVTFVLILPKFDFLQLVSLLLLLVTLVL